MKKQLLFIIVICLLLSLTALCFAACTDNGASGNVGETISSSSGNNTAAPAKDGGTTENKTDPLNDDGNTNNGTSSDNGEATNEGSLSNNDNSGEDEDEDTFLRIDAEGNDDHSGSYLLFGRYPQSEVTDDAITAALTASAGTLPTAENAQKWTSYGYYIENSNDPDYMWYIDLKYAGEKYRGVYFTSYRPNQLSYGSYESLSDQDENGYTTGNLYWFKFEPIKWRILSEENGEALILCESVIDAREYCHYTPISQYEHSFEHNEGSGYANNYELSNIRKWLNDAFYKTTFNSLQKEIILPTTVDNSARSTNPNNNATRINRGINDYACASTEDFVFLLSEQEVTNENYGFSGSLDELDIARQKKNTDYAKAQGAFASASSDYANSGSWWLRSPDWASDYVAYYVFRNGNAYCDYYVYTTNIGVVPALRIKIA